MVAGAMSCVAAVASPQTAAGLVGQDAGALLNKWVFPLVNDTLVMLKEAASTRMPALMQMAPPGYLGPIVHAACRCSNLKQNKVLISIFVGFAI